LYGVKGLTAFSVWNSSLGVQGGGTLITLRHAVVADHFHPGVGNTIQFVGNDNITYSKTILGYQKITSTVGDYGIIVLNSDVPASVGFARIFPVEALNKLSRSQQYWQGAPCQSARLPAVGFNQRKEAFIFDIYSFRDSSEEMDGAVSKWF